MNPGQCNLCRREAGERCGDDVCRDCHKSLTFEECCDGSWTKDLRARAGLTIREWTWEDTRRMLIAREGWDPGTEEEAKARIARPLVSSKQEETFLSVIPTRKDPKR